MNDCEHVWRGSVCHKCGAVWSEFAQRRISGLERELEEARKERDTSAKAVARLTILLAEMESRLESAARRGEAIKAWLKLAKELS